jgi:hypothetical protein
MTSGATGLGNTEAPSGSYPIFSFYIVTLCVRSTLYYNNKWRYSIGRSSYMAAYMRHGWEHQSIITLFD